MTASISLLPTVSFAAAGDLSLFGPKRYERVQGKPWAFTDSFNGCSSSANQALIRVQNGGGRDSSLSSALLTLNGTSVFVEADFKNQTAVLERTVTIRPGSNSLSTQLKSGGQKETPFLVVTVIGLGCDSTPPVISVPQPVDGALLGSSRPVISASYADNSAGAGIDTSSVRVTLDGNDITPACTVDGTSVSCTPVADLPEGGHNITLTVSDLLQNSASLDWRFTTDTIAPAAAITAPASGQYLSSRTVTVSGSIDDPAAAITVNGKAATISGALFSVADVPLAEGGNTLALIAVDLAGNRSESSITVTADTSLPQIVIASPINGSFTGSSPIIVSGTVSELPASLTINGAAVEVSSDLTFTSALSLAEGLNTLTATATDRAGNKGSAIVTVNLDTVKPQIFVTAPVSGSLTKNPSLTVSGTVSEPVTALTVNGQLITVNDLTFTSTLTLAEGPNTIALEALDRAGNQGSAAITVTLDSTPPTAPTLETLITPTNLSPITVVGSAEPLSSLSLYNVAERVATIVTPQEGRFSLPEIALHEGENSFTVTALDLAGNESAPSAPVAVVLDTVKPLVGITAPLDKAILNTPAINVSGPIDDPTATVTVNGLAALNSGGTWSLDNFTLQEGNNSLLVEARDPAGNLGSAVVTVTLDTVLPSVTIANPPDGLYTNMPTQTVSGSVSELLASLTVNGSSTPLTDLTFASTLTLVEGLNTITVEATDLAGNKGQGTVTVNLDTLAPQLSVIGPADGALLNNGQIVFGAGTSEPVVSVTVNGSSAPLTAGTNGYTLPLTLSEGTNNLTVTAIDKAGNSTTTTYTVTLDSTPPVVTVITPAASALVNTPQLTVSGTLSEPVSSLTVNGVAASLTGNSFSAVITLAEGANVITVSAVDLAGNNGSATATVTLDTALPVITVTAPPANAFLNTPQLTVSGTVNEPVSVVTVNGAVATVSGLNFTLPITLTEGVNSLMVRTLDLAGNEGTASLPVNLDTLPPVVTIATPAAGLLTKNAQVTVSGTVNEENNVVTVNGHQATVNGLTFTATLTPAEGQNTLNVRAVDRAGNSGSAAVTVNLDSTAPPAPVLASRTTPTNAPAITLSGTAEAGSTVRISAAGTLLGTVVADAQGNFTLTNVTLAEGVNSYTAIAGDAAGNESPVSAPLIIVLDTVKPVITVTAPVAGVIISSADVLIAGSVSEALASLTVNGGPVQLNSLAFEQSMSLAAGENSALITATDPAGNVATVTLTIVRDSTPPLVTITTPLPGLLTRNSAVQVSGTVDDAEATLTVNGATVTNSSKTFSFTYTLNEGDNGIMVEATDKAGNKGSASVSVTLDAMAPTLAITAPAEAVAGANIAINLNVGDNRGLALVELKVDGVPIWSGGNVPAIAEAVSYRLSPTLNAGAVVALQAKGSDAAGNETSSSATILITQAAMGPGYIQGKVLDDSRGLKIEGAEVLITQQLNNSTNSLTSAADGGYFSETQAGSALVAMTKSGFTRVERLVPVMPEKKVMIPDARLTKINETKNLIDATGGTVRVDVGAGASPPAIEITVPAAALSAQADIRLTPVSNQGLAGVLPLGWSPLAAVDIRLLDPAAATALDATFASVVVLKIPLPLSLMLTQGTVLTLAVYDGDRHQWESRGNAAIAVDGLSASAEISTSGQYALLVADPAPNAPPAAEAGMPLAPASSSNPDFAAISVSGKVVPQASPPSTGLKAAGEVLLTVKEGAYPAPQFTSGLILNSRITEKFELKSGDKIDSPTYTQDIVLYNAPCITNIGGGAVTPLTESGVELRTTFPVSPSKDYTIVDLLLGKVGIEIFKPEVADSGVMVGADGGRLLDGDGNVLVIPAGSLSQTTPVSTKSVSGATGAVGDDFTFIKAVEMNLTRQTLAASATLSIPSPDGFNPSLPLIVAKQIDVKGVAKLKLVAMAKQVGSFITSEQLIPQLSNSSTSINSSGTYFFLQAKAPIGFITGTVTDAANSAYTGALVKTDKGSLVDLAGANGRYLLAAPVAQFTATALDLYKNDEVSGNSAVTAANQVVTLDLKIEKIPPTVVSVSPANGAVKVQPDVSVIVTFSKAMDKNSITSATLVVRDATGSAVTGTLTFNIDNKTVTFYPADAFKQETQYTVTVAATVKDLQGYPLGQDVVSNFTIRKTTPPPMPPAGNVSATFPDADGFITITATQGTAPVDCTVLLINDTTGEIVSVTPATNGSFASRLRAQLGDEIKVVLMDYSGNQTTISYLTFKNTDGSYLVTAKGGKVEGESDSILEIPEGALIGPTVVRITPVAEVNLPHPLPGPGKYLGAVNLDSGGIGFQKKVDISLPLPPGFDPATPVFLTKPGEVVNVDGTVEKVYEIIDSTKVVNGRITTACWPYDGVLAAGTYAFTAFPELIVGIVSGYTYQDMNEQSGYQPTSDGLPEVPTERAADNTLIYHFDRPVRGAVIRSAQAWNYVSYSRSNGFYSAFSHYYGNIGTSGCLDYQKVAIHPLTMQRVTINGNACTPPYNVEKLNFKLADKGTIPPDRSAPLIDMKLQVLPGQPDANRIVAGTTIAGTKMKLPISIIDQAMGTATLTIKYKEPGGSASTEDQYVVDVPSSGVFYSFQKEEQAQLYKYDSTVKFSSDPTLNYFTANAPGYYTFILVAKDAANPPNVNNRTIELHVIQAGDSLGTSIPGPPRVDAVFPEDGSKDIMVTTQIVATFSEPVQNVIAYNGPGMPVPPTFKLIDTNTGELVPAVVILGIEGGRMQATLTPKGNLYYARDYKVVLTTGITDTDSTPTAMAADFVATFRTKDPKAYDLATAQQFEGGRDIDLYTFTDTAGESDTYAYVLAGNSGWRIIDVTDPTEPEVIHTASPACNLATDAACRRTASEFTYRSVAVHPDRNRELMAMIENINYPDGNQFGYIRFYDLSLEPGNPPIIGREKLAENYSGIPGKLALYGDYAVVNTAGVGIQIVNSKQAIKNQTDNKPSDGSAIAGTLDTIGQGYGSPNDLAIFNEKSAVFTTNPGWLLAVDLNLPTEQTSIDNNDPVLPLVMNAFKPAGYSFTKIGVAAGFPYTDDNGMEKSINLAVAGISQGKIVTLDLSDMTNPLILGEASTSTAADASGVPIISTIRDISVSKDAGLAYVTTYNSIQVYDIKNQGKPRFLNEIKELPDPSGALNLDGSPRMIPIGETPAIVEKGGWVYLANAKKGFRALDLDPPDFDILLLVDGVISNGKIKIKNISGEPVMPKLEVEIISRNDRVPIQNVCLDVSVDYNLVVPSEVKQPHPIYPNKNTVFAYWSNPTYRTRKGISTKDGFKLAQSCNTSLRNPVDWNHNFGGGILSVKATVYRPSSVIDNIKRDYVQGETISENSQNKLDITRYLDAPDGVSNFRTILTEFGYDHFFRIVSYHESGYRHFERLKEKGYSKMSPWIGYVAETTYPLVNKKIAFNGPYTDGGLGCMQLTQTNPKDPKWPSYEQIWNFKKNINAGVNLINYNLGLARSYPAIVRTRGCVARTYIVRGKPRTKSCRPMPETPIFGRALDFDPYQKRMDVYSLYNSNWHYWLWNNEDGWVPHQSKIDSQKRGSAYADLMDALEDNLPTDF